MADTDIEQELERRKRLRKVLPVSKENLDTPGSSNTSEDSFYDRLKKFFNGEEKKKKEGAGLQADALKPSPSPSPR